MYLLLFFFFYVLSQLNKVPMKNNLSSSRKVNYWSGKSVTWLLTLKTNNVVQFVRTELKDRNIENKWNDLFVENKII